MDRLQRLRRANSTIFWTFSGIMFSYSIFLGDLSDVFIRLFNRHPILSRLNEVINSLSSLQILIVLAVALFISIALAVSAGAPAHRFLKFVPLGCVLMPTLTLLLAATCTSGLANGGACAPSFLYSLEGVAILVLWLSPLLLAWAISRSELSGWVQRLALAPLSVVALCMGLQMVIMLVWGVAGWPASQATVSGVALTHHIQILPGDWHIWMVIGVISEVFFGALALSAVWNGFPALFKVPRGS